ncbi:hypothetical protein [Iamia sp.]|uniref:hypothetical protein n=1 Tax=Iamia sp. TaxID=2722710 RepID=UPI002CF1F040|nr:hypothetical protein [Iamia sp.]HXH57883.1 hypothetical protein [Iamia sp.]
MANAHVIDLENAGRTILASLLGRQFGSTRVMDGEVEVGPDGDDQIAIVLRLLLSDPTGDGGWPNDDVRALRDAYRRIRLEVDVDAISYLAFESQRDRDEAAGDLAGPDPAR